MKKQISIATALVAASGFSYGEIKINEYLSIEGFVTADYAVNENENNGVSESDNYFGVSEVEIDWLFNFDRVSGRIDLQHEDLNTSYESSGTLVEQAFMTYELWDGGTLTAGRYASMLGYEDFERPGLHQYSFAHDLHDINPGQNALDSTNIGITPGYNQGLKYTYDSNGNMFAVSLQDSIAGDDDRFGGDDNGSYGLEVAGSIQLAEGLRWFTGVAYQDSDQVNAEEDVVANTYLAYESGPLTLGAELSHGIFDSGIAGVQVDVWQALLVANYAYSESASITGRISYTEAGVDVAGTIISNVFDATKFTIAHNYAFTDNLALVNEVSIVDSEDLAGDESEAVLGAASLVFTF